MSSGKYSNSYPDSSPTSAKAASDICFTVTNPSGTTKYPIPQPNANDVAYQDFSFDDVFQYQYYIAEAEKMEEENGYEDFSSSSSVLNAWLDSNEIPSRKSHVQTIDLKLEKWKHSHVSHTNTGNCKPRSKELKAARLEKMQGKN